jgi:hypothetical protein
MKRTVIEMLLVAVIIGIVAAIAIPHYAADPLSRFHGTRGVGWARPSYE